MAFASPFRQLSRPLLAVNANGKSVVVVGEFGSGDQRVQVCNLGMSKRGRGVTV